MYKGSSYQEILNRLLVSYIEEFEAEGNRLIGNQPVWQGQLVDGLILALESGMVAPELREKLRNVIISAVTNLDREEMRVVEGEYQMVYSRPNEKHSSTIWESLENYSFFWLNSFQWVEQQGVELIHSSENIYQWVIPKFMEREIGSRQWSAVMSFPTNYVNQRNSGED